MEVIELIKLLKDYAEPGICVYGDEDSPYHTFVLIKKDGQVIDSIYFSTF